MSSVGLRAVGDRVRLVDTAPARDTPIEAALPVAWQRLWLATQRRPWRSLVVVPAGEGVSTVRVARALAEAGACHLGHVIQVTDATSITLGRLRASVEAWIERSGAPERVILALAPVLGSPASAALARTADAAILCLTLHESSIADAQRTIEEIGQDRFLGSVCLRRGGEGR